MHTEVKDFIREVKDRYPEMFKDKKVLECGSRDINGSPREFFADCDYTGIDLMAGKGVDKVISINDHMNTIFDGYDVIICTEVMEHNKDWENNWMDMGWTLLEQGLIIMTCAGPARAPHGIKNHNPTDSPATNDYYGNRKVEDFFIPEDAIWSIAELRRDDYDLCIAYKL